MQLRWKLIQMMGCDMETLLAEWNAGLITSMSVLNLAPVKMPCI